MLAGVFLCVFALVAFPFGVLHGAEDLPVVRVGYSGFGVNSTLVQVAERADLWRKHGLDFKYIYFTSGGLLAQALLAEEVMFADGDIPAAVSLAAAGVADVKVLAVTVNRLEHFFVVEKAVQNPPDLKGRRLAISRYGSASDLTTRIILRFWGLDPDRQVAILQVGNTPARIAALITGQVHGALITPEQLERVMASGCCRVLADLSELPLPYARFGIATTSAVIKKRPELVEKLLVAMIEAIHYFKNNPEVAIEVYQRGAPGVDREKARDLHARLSRALRDYPLPEPKGLQAVLDSLPNPKARGFPVQMLVEVSFLEKIRKSGYIDRLYGPGGK
jgi:ABC-type nitrate/sulfonate/bicarbonate transport system substrate-binding protein